METLDSYWEFARKMIATRTRSPIRELMLNDDEAVGIVAKAVMKADDKYDEEMGTKLNTWRYILADKAIKKRIKSFSGRQKMESLEFADNIPSSCPTPDDIITRCEENEETKSRVKKLLSFTNPTQRVCLEMSFLLGFSDQEIANELGITSEGVRKSKISGIALMRELRHGH